MLTVIGQFLPNAFGIALSPMPLIFLLVLMFSSRPRIKAISLVLGWWIGVALMAGLVIALGLEPSTNGPRAGMGWVNLAMGLLFAFLAVTSWRGRPRPDKPSRDPGWMSKVDDMSPIAVLGFTAVLIAINAKNTALIVTGALWISGSAIPILQQIIALAIFAVLSSAFALAITAAFLLAGQRVEPMLTALKEWLERNNAYVMTFLFAYLAVSALGKAISMMGS
ncbi:MAG: GAP family protein [Beutenbergiaceae bacterium]